MNLETYKSNHNTYGGRIYATDFDTAYCCGNTAERIISDMKFDEMCRRNLETRERMNKNA